MESYKIAYKSVFINLGWLSQNTSKWNDWESNGSDCKERIMI